MKTFKGIGAQLVLSFVVAICVSIILVSHNKEKVVEGALEQLLTEILK